MNNEQIEMLVAELNRKIAMMNSLTESHSAGRERFLAKAEAFEEALNIVNIVRGNNK